MTQVLKQFFLNVSIVYVLATIVTVWIYPISVYIIASLLLAMIMALWAWFFAWALEFYYETHKR